MLGILSTLAQVSSSYDYDYSYSTTPADGAAAAAVGLGMLMFIFVFVLVAYLFFAFCMYKVFKKAGRQDAWAAFVPIYNTYVMFEIAGRPGWWAFLGFIPIVGGVAALVTAIIGTLDLVKSFGKSGGYAALLILVPIVGWPMLAFGDATYKGPAGPEGSKTPPVQPGPTSQAPTQPAM